MSEAQDRAMVREHMLFRRSHLAADKTLGFIVAIKINATPEGRYAASVVSLEPGTVTGGGATADAAERDALELFQDMVDNCIQRGQLPELIGECPIMRVLDVCLDDLIGPMVSDDAVTIPPPWVFAPGWKATAIESLQ